MNKKATAKMASTKTYKYDRAMIEAAKRVASYPVPISMVSNIKVFNERG
jgi:hypothetical protein